MEFLVTHLLESSQMEDADTNLRRLAYLGQRQAPCWDVG